MQTFSESRTCICYMKMWRRMDNCCSRSYSERVFLRLRQICTYCCRRSTPNACASYICLLLSWNQRVFFLLLVRNNDTSFGEPCYASNCVWFDAPRKYIKLNVVYIVGTIAFTVCFVKLQRIIPFADFHCFWWKRINRHDNYRFGDYINVHYHRLHEAERVLVYLKHCLSLYPSPSSCSLTSEIFFYYQWSSTVETSATFFPSERFHLAVF